jgi:DedD protein
VVLLGIGIVGFPLLFETQPRPLAGDIPIEIVGKATAPATNLPVRPPAEPVSEPVAPPPSAVITERPGDAGTEVPPPKPAAKPAAAAVTAMAASTISTAAAPAPKAAASAVKAEHAAIAPAPPARAVTAPASAPTTAATTAHDDGARAQALLNGGAAASAAPAASAPGRFVVQVGAYTDANALRDARQRVEKLGLKTYTQQVDSEAGKRTRVRVGPFATRKEAEAAAAKLKAAGLPTGLLAL